MGTVQTNSCNEPLTLLFYTYWQLSTRLFLYWVLLGFHPTCWSGGRKPRIIEGTIVCKTLISQLFWGETRDLAQIVISICTTILVACSTLLQRVQLIQIVKSSEQDKHQMTEISRWLLTLRTWCKSTFRSWRMTSSLLRSRGLLSSRYSIGWLLSPLASLHCHTG